MNAHWGFILERVACWAIILAGLFLPPLSVNGFSIASAEGGFILLACIMIAIVLAFVSHIRLINSFLIMLALIGYACAYFGSQNWWASQPYIPYALAGVIGSLFYMGLFFPREMRVIIASMAFTYLLSSAALALPMTSEITNSPQLATGNGGPVIHGLLDEHINLLSVPREALSDEQRQEFVHRYTERGFLVFMRAYSEWPLTHQSVARLFNPSLGNIHEAMVQRSHPQRWSYQKADLLKEIAKRRELILSTPDLIDFSPALENEMNVQRMEWLHVTHVGSSASRGSLSIRERLLYAVSRGLRWWKNSFASPLVPISLASSTALQHTIEVSGSLTALDYLKSAFELLSKTNQSLWYAYIHVLIPHTPYTYSEKCDVLPVRNWLSWSQSARTVVNMEWRLDRFRAHMRQLQCATSRFLAGVDRLRQRRDWPETTVIVHGDHGSRITFQNRADWDAVGYTENAYRLDMYGTFMAVRLPGRELGEIIDRPVRIDDVFSALVHNDFRTLDIEALPRRADPIVAN